MELDVLPYFRMQAGDTSLRLSFDIQESMVRGGEHRYSSFIR